MNITKQGVKNLIITLLALAIANCSVESHKPIVAENSTSGPTIREPIATVNDLESIETSTQAVLPEIGSEKIPPGGYLIYFDWIQNDLHVLSLDDVKYDVSVADRWGVFTSDAEFFAFVRDKSELVIIDWEEKVSTISPLEVSCGNLPTWSNDKRMLAIECNNAFIYVFSRSDQSLTQLTNWGQPSVDSFLLPAWSPDGEQIAFVYRDLTSLSSSELNGIYITDISCLNDLETCKEKTIGPFVPYSSPDLFTWSPDSSRLAVFNPEVDAGSIVIIDISTGEERHLLGNLKSIDGVTWIYDGDRNAYSIGGSIFLIDINGNEPELLAEDKGYLSASIEIIKE